VRWKQLCPYSGWKFTTLLQSVKILAFTIHTRYHWYHLLCVGIYGLRFGFRCWNLSIGCIYFLGTCTSGVCFRQVFSDAVRSQWYTLLNVYITRRSPSFFTCWPNLNSLTTRRQYQRKKMLVTLLIIYRSSDNVLSRSHNCVIWGFYIAIREVSDFCGILIYLLTAIGGPFTPKQYTERHKTNNKYTIQQFGIVRIVPRLG